MQARSQDFVQEGPTWRGLKVSPNKNRKLLELGPLFFRSGPIFFYSLMFMIKFVLLFRSGGGGGGMAPMPSSWLRP